MGAGGDLSNVTVPAIFSGTAHGTRVTGMPPKILQPVRRTMTMACVDRPTSASLTLQYMVSKRPNLDPTYGAFRAPIIFRSRLALGGCGVQWAEVHSAWQKQIVRLGKSNGPWTVLAGHAGATYIVLRMLGACMSTAFRIKLHQVVTVDLRGTAPSSFDWPLCIEIEAYLWRVWASASSAKQDNIPRNPGGYSCADLPRLCNRAGKDWTSRMPPQSGVWCIMAPTEAALRRHGR